MTSPEPTEEPALDPAEIDEDTFKTLKYSLLGPSLTKAGQDAVDQSKVSEIIYNASKGSKFFNREEVRDKTLTQKIEHILARKKELEKQDLSRDLRNADRLITELEITRDLSQHIVHVDCDAFYAAVEQLERPELKELPFAVGGGVLTTCNYVARQFGCRSGMAGFVAKKLCPSLILLKPNFEKYTAKAQEVREVLADYDPRFESSSIDEAYLNVTEYCIEKDMDPADAVNQMRREIHQKTQITVSAGIAANSKLAKICSNVNKPNGQYVLSSDRNVIMAFIRDMPTRKINGIGRVLERELKEIGVETCGDLYSQRQYLRRLFGDKTFEFLMQIHLGLGRTKVQPAEEYERKSVGTESTFGDMSDPAKLREKLRWTADELEKDMKRAECKGRTLCLKVKLHTFEVLTRQVATPRSICLADDLYNYSAPILARLEQEFPGMKLRLMGLRCSHLVSTKPPDTMAFFGFRPRRKESVDQEIAGVKRKASEPLDDDGWERLPDGMLDDETRPSKLKDTEPTQGPEDVHGSYGKHGKEILPNPKKDDKDEAEEWWDCPICGRPQTTDERLFNDHIDLCLSRQTIRDAVQTSRPEAPPARASTPQDGKRKKGRPSVVDPKQTRLSFG